MDEDDDLRLPYDEPEEMGEERHIVGVREGVGLGPVISTSTLIISGSAMPTPRVERAGVFDDELRDENGDGRRGGRYWEESSGRGLGQADSGSAERDREAGEKHEQDRMENKRLETERNEEERERQRQETAHFEVERVEREETESEHLEAERAEREGIEASRFEERRIEGERLGKEKTWKDRVEAERLENERSLEAERVEQERVERADVERTRQQAEETTRRRKESIRENLRRGRSEGGLMLVGVSCLVVNRCIISS